MQARNTLRQLRAASTVKFTLRLKEMTKHAPIWEVLDNLHATVGFCAEPASLVSPMSEFGSIEILLLSQNLSYNFIIWAHMDYEY